MSLRDDIQAAIVGAAVLASEEKDAATDAVMAVLANDDTLTEALGCCRSFCSEQVSDAAAALLAELEGARGVERPEDLEPTDYELRAEG